MDLRLGSVSVAVSTLNLFDTLAILLLIPLFDAIVYPQLKRRGLAPSMLQKIGCGFVTAVLAMLVAGALEIYRKSHVRESPCPPPPARCRGSSQSFGRQA